MTDAEAEMFAAEFRRAQGRLGVAGEAAIAHTEATIDHVTASEPAETGAAKVAVLEAHLAALRGDAA